MIPTSFQEVNCVLGANQPQYLPLPVHNWKDDIFPFQYQGKMTMSFQLTDEERKRIEDTGLLWLTVLTFNEPFQPILLETIKPDFET